MHRGSNTGNFSTILTTSSDVDDELLSNVIPYQITADNKNFPVWCSLLLCFRLLVLKAPQ